jgi:hypothetical protein
MFVRIPRRLFAPVAPSVAPKEARSRLRSSAVRSSEFVHSACLDSITGHPGGQDHSAYFPDHGNLRRGCPHIAGDGPRQVRAGSSLALGSDRSVRSGSRVKRDFACAFTRHVSPVLVVLRPQSCLRLEGRTRTLSGPSPALRPARTVAWCHPAASRNGRARLPPCQRGTWPVGWPSGDGRYGFVSTAPNRKDATAPFASSGAFGLVLHWPLCGPDLYLGPYPAK